MFSSASTILLSANAKTSSCVLLLFQLCLWPSLLWSVLQSFVAISKRLHVKEIISLHTVSTNNACGDDM